jgi:hypothetical protein
MVSDSHVSWEAQSPIPTGLSTGGGGLIHMCETYVMNHLMVMCDGKRTGSTKTSNYALEVLTQFIHPNESCGVAGAWLNMEHSERGT